MHFKKLIRNSIINPVLIILVTCNVLPINSNESSSNWEPQTCKNPQKGHNCKDSSERPIFITDAINYFFRELDTDETDYLIIDEVIPSVKTCSIIPLGDAEAVEKTNKYFEYLDENYDGVIDIYELRFMLHAINLNSLSSEYDNDSDFIYWIKSFSFGESANPQQQRRYLFYLVKIYQLFDEDINGKLTWKEIRMAIKMAELFRSVKEELLMDERAKEELVAEIKANPQQKWVNLEELWGIFYKLGVDSDAVFYDWIRNYLGGDSERNSGSVKDSTRKEFSDADLDSNGVITKGEITALLHKHRENYYSTERINRRWTRADRNQDGVITFNEYVFLENLKHPQRK